MSAYQIAVFRNPKVSSNITSSLSSKVAKGGIQCELIDFPEEPKSSASIQNGEWLETSNGNILDYNNSFKIRLSASDNATSNLLSKLKIKKMIDEIVIYELMTTANKPSYGYYLSKIFIKSAATGQDREGWKYVNIEGVCASFKQRTKDNCEPILWDSETMTNRYSGKIR